VVSPVTEPSHAVFLSYASQDAEAAKRICDALRAAGIEVWFDQSELRGGEAWDRQIRKQIHDCALFIPVISANAHARVEGYFRLEWKLAVDRSHLMAPDQTFLLPVVIDSTPQSDERIPDRFRELQWSRLPNGQVPPAFIDRVWRLLSPVESDARTTIRPELDHVSVASPTTRAPVRVFWSKRSLQAAFAVVVLGALGYLGVDKYWASKKPAAPSTTPAAQTSVATAAFNPPPHSIAVLPFVNMSGDKEQDYFSDGLSEELLNDLSRINELQVAARTSAFSFKGKDTDIGTIARKLNVGAVLEGSVRRSGHTIRITTQLINALTGFHLWSQTYDRDLGDVLKLQTEIAEAAAGALKVTLLGDVATKIEIGGTHNPAAFDAYLRGTKAFSTFNTSEELEAVIASFTEAIRLDPDYALALARRSIALSIYAENYTKGPSVRASFDAAEVDAHKAIALAPELAESHLALANFLAGGSLEFRHAAEEYERARALSPGNALVLRGYGYFAAQMGRTEAAMAAMRRAVALDPLDPFTRSLLGQVLYYAHRYDESISAYQDELVLDADDPDAYLYPGLAHYMLGDLQKARSACEAKPADGYGQPCLAITYDRLGRRADAQAMLEKVKVSGGDRNALDIAVIYAQWGNTAKALEWLERALRMREPSLVSVRVDPLLDPLRKEPRFQAVMRELKFPD
jgi:TolB-like protein/Flp pilus assembly protein TadD